MVQGMWVLMHSDDGSFLAKKNHLERMYNGVSIDRMWGTELLELKLPRSKVLVLS